MSSVEAVALGSGYGVHPDLHAPRDKTKQPLLTPHSEGSAKHMLRNKCDVNSQ